MRPALSKKLHPCNVQITDKARKLRAAERLEGGRHCYLFTKLSSIQASWLTL